MIGNFMYGTPTTIVFGDGVVKELSNVLGAELQKASYDKADGDVIFVQTN